MMVIFLFVLGILQIAKVVNEVYHSYNRHQYPFIVLLITMDKRKSLGLWWMAGDVLGLGMGEPCTNLMDLRSLLFTSLYVLPAVKGICHFSLNCSGDQNLFISFFPIIVLFIIGVVYFLFC